MRESSVLTASEEVSIDLYVVDPAIAKRNASLIIARFPFFWPRADPTIRIYETLIASPTPEAIAAAASQYLAAGEEIRALVANRVEPQEKGSPMKIEQQYLEDSMGVRNWLLRTKHLEIRSIFVVLSRTIKADNTPPPPGRRFLYDLVEMTDRFCGDVEEYHELPAESDYRSDVEETRTPASWPRTVAGWVAKSRYAQKKFICAERLLRETNARIAAYNNSHPADPVPPTTVAPHEVLYMINREFADPEGYARERAKKAQALRLQRIQAHRQADVRLYSDANDNAQDDDVLPTSGNA